MTTHARTISIWFFIGISLLVNGLLIFGAGLYEYASTGQNFRWCCSSLHAGVWWGGLLALIGGFYYLALPAIAWITGFAVVTQSTAVHKSWFDLESNKLCLAIILAGK